MNNQVRIEHDDDPLNVVEKINRVLKPHGLVLVNDSLPDDDFCTFTLQTSVRSERPDDVGKFDLADIGENGAG